MATITKTYMNVDLYGKAVKVPYCRYRIKEEYRADGTTEYVVALDGAYASYAHRHNLSWERWVAVMSPEADVEYCLGELRRHSGKSYRLFRHTNGHHWLLFGTREGAEQCAIVFCDTLGTANIS